MLWPIDIQSSWRGFVAACECRRRCCCCCCLAVVAVPHSLTRSASLSDLSWSD